MDRKHAGIKLQIWKCLPAKWYRSNPNGDSQQGGPYLAAPISAAGGGISRTCKANYYKMNLVNFIKATHQATGVIEIWKENLSS